MFVKILKTSGIDFYFYFSGKNINYMDSFNFRQRRFLDNVFFQNIECLKFIRFFFHVIKYNICSFDLLIIYNTDIYFIPTNVKLRTRFITV